MTSFFGFLPPTAHANHPRDLIKKTKAVIPTAFTDASSTSSSMTTTTTTNMMPLVNTNTAIMLPQQKLPPPLPSMGSSAIPVPPPSSVPLMSTAVVNPIPSASGAVAAAAPINMSSSVHPSGFISSLPNQISSDPLTRMTQAFSQLKLNPMQQSQPQPPPPPSLGMMSLPPAAPSLSNFANSNMMPYPQNNVVQPPPPPSLPFQSHTTAAARSRRKTTALSRHHRHATSSSRRSTLSSSSSRYSSPSSTSSSSSSEEDDHKEEDDNEAEEEEEEPTDDEEEDDDNSVPSISTPSADDEIEWCEHHQKKQHNHKKIKTTLPSSSHRRGSQPSSTLYSTLLPKMENQFYRHGSETTKSGRFQPFKPFQTPPAAAAPVDTRNNDRFDRLERLLLKQQECMMRSMNQQPPPQKTAATCGEGVCSLPDDNNSSASSSFWNSTEEQQMEQDLKNPRHLLEMQYQKYNFSGIPYDRAEQVVVERKEQEKKTQFIRSTVGATKWVAALFVASIKLLSKQPIPMDDTIQSSINEGLPAIEAWYNECSPTYQYQGKWDFILMMIMNMTKPLIDMIGDKATQKIAETSYRYQPTTSVASTSAASATTFATPAPASALPSNSVSRFIRLSSTASSMSSSSSSMLSSSSSNNSSGGGGGFINMVPSVVDAHQSGFNMIQQLAGDVGRFF